MDIYSVGEMVIDFIPGNKEGEYIRNAGGAPANVAIAVARNGLDAGICCKVGNDDFGKFLVNTLKKEKVKVLSKSLCEEAITTMAFVSLSENGERSFTFARKPGADMFLRPDEISKEEIEDAVIVHAGSCSLSAEPVALSTRRALEYGHELGKLVSFDINYRNLMWNDEKEKCTNAVRSILPYVDILKLSEEEVDMAGGVENIPNLMEENQLTAVILTLGADGAEAYFKDTKIPVRAKKVNAVDATGAGDAFWGGFLSSLRFQKVERAEDITAEKLKNAMEYGSICGALCVKKKGAIASLPTREEAEKMLGEERL